MKLPNCLTQAPNSLLSCAAFAVEKSAPNTALAKDQSVPAHSPSYASPPEVDQELLEIRMRGRAVKAHPNG